MRLTAKGQYSVTAMVDLSMHSDSKQIAHADIATCYSVLSLSQTFLREERRDPAELFIAKSVHAQ